jgi:hypothetical protein
MTCPPPPAPGGEASAEQPQSDLPVEFALQQNYPNPFNPATIISYQLPVSQNSASGRGHLDPSYHVTLKVYDMLGQEAATLVNGQINAGYQW